MELGKSIEMISFKALLLLTHSSRPILISELNLIQSVHLQDATSTSTKIPHLATISIIQCQTLVLTKILSTARILLLALSWIWTTSLSWELLSQGRNGIILPKTPSITSHQDSTQIWLQPRSISMIHRLNWIINGSLKTSSLTLKLNQTPSVPQLAVPNTNTRNNNLITISTIQCLTLVKTVISPIAKILYPW